MAVYKLGEPSNFQVFAIPKLSCIKGNCIPTTDFPCFAGIKLRAKLYAFMIVHP
jgi:hypothetical protein